MILCFVKYILGTDEIFSLLLYFNAFFMKNKSGGKMLIFNKIYLN